MEWFGLGRLQDNFNLFFTSWGLYHTNMYAHGAFAHIGFLRREFLVFSFHPDMILHWRCMWYVMKEISPFFHNSKHVCIKYHLVLFLEEMVLKRKKKMANMDTDLMVNCKTSFFFSFLVLGSTFIPSQMLWCIVLQSYLNSYII